MSTETHKSTSAHGEGYLTHSPCYRCPRHQQPPLLSARTFHLLLYPETEWMLDLCAAVMARAWQTPWCDVLSWLRVKQGCAVSLFEGFVCLSIRLGNKFLTFCFHLGGMLFDRGPERERWAVRSAPALTQPEKQKQFCIIAFNLMCKQETLTLIILDFRPAHNPGQDYLVEGIAPLYPGDHTPVRALEIQR
ncbi:unnamed protein product [Trypanosoma congolense IL3000]|uniref:WGS project CAEQ00000000 data, annotated contig 2288 n=1 Tax=Trypanosoma congolense (strain IL3000) TaxID=1068625 RepID=F9WCX8_TRYCI|nr:unnamed protein product [Trypanosoma congolense IL3000]